MTKFKKYYSYLNISKCLIALFYFFIFITFFSDNNLILLFKKISYLKKLERREKGLEQEIFSSTLELNLLKTNAQSIEKYAREKYLMKKDNEDLFIVKPAPENK